MTSHGDVLRFLNEVRADLSIGEPLSSMPAGRPHSVRACPIAQAMVPATAIVCGLEIWFPKTDETIALPEHVQEFVDRFDRLEYPELLDG